MLLIALGGFASDSARAATAPAVTAPFDLVQAYVRQIGTFEEDRSRAAKDQAANKTDFASCVRNMTTFQMDLDASGRYLMAVRLSSDNMAKEIPPLVGALIMQKYAVVDELVKECEAFIAPDPKIDYTLLAQRAPKITAMSDYIDKAIFESSPGMFATLISPRADSHNRANHLVITHQQRDRLLSSLTSYFGEKLNMSGNDVPYYVAVAQLLRDKLNEFKCADDPWE